MKAFAYSTTSNLVSVYDQLTQYVSLSPLLLSPPPSPSLPPPLSLFNSLLPPLFSVPSSFISACAPFTLTPLTSSPLVTFSSYCPSHCRPSSPSHHLTLLLPLSSLIRLHQCPSSPSPRPSMMQKKSLRVSGSEQTRPGRICDRWVVGTNRQQFVKLLK